MSRWANPDRAICHLAIFTTSDHPAPQSEKNTPPPARGGVLAAYSALMLMIGGGLSVSGRVLSVYGETMLMDRIALRAAQTSAALGAAERCAVRRQSLRAKHRLLRPLRAVS